LKSNLKYVTSPEIFYRGNNKSFHDDGIFSEKIFGPVRSFRCKCGLLNNSVLDVGKRCEKCGVKCEDNIARFENHGLINLPFMCIKPTRIDNRLKAVIVNILAHKKTLLDPIRSDYNISQSKYLGIHKSTEVIKIFDNRNDKNYVYIPIRVTGIYSLLLCLKYMAEVFNIEIVKKLFEDQVIMTYLKVIPPGLRPVSVVDDKKIQLSEVNKPYISIIHLNKVNDLIKDNLLIDQDDWFERINLYFQGDYDTCDEEIVEHIIMEYDVLTSKYQYHINMIYDNLFSTIAGKEGFIRKNLLGKTIDFSGRSVICCDPSLNVYQIGVSKKILYKLWLPYFLYYLLHIKLQTTVWSIENIVNKDYEDNLALFDEFLEWFYAE